MSREEHLHIRGKVPPFNPSSILLDGLQLYLCSKLLENGAKFIQKLTPGFKNHMRNLDNLCLDNLWNMDKQWKVHEVEIQWATLSKKYIPSAKTLVFTINTEDLTLLSTTVKIHQVPLLYVIFETIA